MLDDESYQRIQKEFNAAHEDYCRHAMVLASHTGTFFVTKQTVREFRKIAKARALKFILARDRWNKAHEAWKKELDERHPEPQKEATINSGASGGV